MKTKIIENVLLIVISITFVINIVFMNLFPVYSNALLIVGYIILAAGAVLVILSIFTILKKMNKEVVSNGVYGIVRHPMYVGGIVMFFSHFFLGQNWVVAVSTVIGIAGCFFIIDIEDKKIRKEFGNNYIKYSKSVPKMNVLAGILRRIKDRG